MWCLPDAYIVAKELVIVFSVHFVYFILGLCCPSFQKGDGILDLILSFFGPSGLKLQLLNCLFIISDPRWKDHYVFGLL